MTIKHVQQNGDIRFRPNRMERRPPFLSNVVRGDAKQETPNGVSFGEVEGSQPLRKPPGSMNGLPQTEPIPAWPIGHRTGE